MKTAKIVERKTKETTVRVEAAIGTGRARVDTTVPFLDHMMTALAKYSGVDLTITARGDLRALDDRGVAGAVLGMALYTGALDPRVVAEEFAS